MKTRIIETRYEGPTISRAAYVTARSCDCPDWRLALKLGQDQEEGHTLAATQMAFQRFALNPLVLSRILYSPLEGLAVFAAQEGGW